MTTDAKFSGWVAAGLYSVAFVAIFFPLLDLVTTVLPFRPTNFQWRYGALGLAPGYLHLPIIGAGVLFAVATVRQHRGVMKWSGALSMLTSLVLLVALGVFLLDVMEMRGMRAAEERSLILAGGAIQATKYVVGVLVLALLGLGGWITAGRLSTGAAGKDAKGGSSRIVTSSARAESGE